MGRAPITVLKAVIALCLIGAVVVQVMILPAIQRDLAGDGAPVWAQIYLLTTAFLGVLCAQVFGVCVWRLLTMVRRGSVFSRAAFGYVNTIIGAFLVAAALLVGLAVFLAPGEAAPGVVGLLCGFALVLGGMALLMVVMRGLLRQAAEWRTELEGVV